MPGLTEVRFILEDFSCFRDLLFNAQSDGEAFFVAGGHGSILCTVVMLECEVSGLPGPPKCALWPFRGNP